MTLPATNRIGDLTRALLDRGYAQATRQTLNAIGASVGTGLIHQRLGELDAEAARLQAAGLPLKPDNPVLRALLADLDTELTRIAARVDASGADAQRVGLEAAARLTRELALPGVNDAQLRLIGVAWNVPDPEAVNALVNYVNSPGWRDELARYPQTVLDTVRNQAIRGMVEGWNPLQTARLIRRMAEGVPGAQANTLMRTVQLQSYRDAAVIQRMANADILTEQIRIAALDARTCFVAGTLITTTEGQKPIELVKVGDMVLTHTGTYKRVVATMKRRYRGRAQTVRSAKAAVTATANHPFLINRDGNCDWIAAEHCKIGDAVFVNTNYVADDGNHISGDSTIEGNIRNTNHRETLRYEAGSFAPIRVGAFMPVNPINLQSDIQAGQVKIDRIAIQRSFLFKRFCQRLKAQPDILFRFSFARMFTVATRGTEFLVSHSWHNSKVFATGHTHFVQRWTTAFLGTIMTLIAMHSKHIATSFTRRIFGVDRFAFGAAYPVSVGIRRRDGELLTANGASFSNISPLVATSPTTKACIPFLHFGGTQFKGFSADLASEFNAFALGYTHASRTAIKPLASIHRGEEFPANLTRFFVHDGIISNTASLIECDVFNLGVEVDHSYVANGFVVHNCMACVALHGTRLPINERINDHHNGRCTSISVVRGVPREVRSGEDWFNGLGEERQRQQMGDAAFELWKRGRIDLRDFVQPYTDRVFGEMVKEASVKGMLGR